MSGSSSASSATVTAVAPAATSARPVALVASAAESLRKRLRLLAFGALVAGVVFRTVPLALNPVEPLTTCDGQAYHDLAVSLAGGHGLTFSDPALLQVCGDQVALGASHHYAPALPIIEAGFIALLGDTALALYLPLVILSLAAVVVAWWTTRDLFGADAALLVAAAVSVDPTGVSYGTVMGYSENLVFICITLTLWAILRGLRDDRFIVLAGLFAGLGYVSKASIGWFFIIAGLGGVAYRVLFRGWRVLLNRWYWLGIAVFAVPVVLWSLRNLSLFWDGSLGGLFDAWQTSAAQARDLAAAVDRPGLLLVGLIGKLPLLALLATVPYLPLISGIRAGLRNWRDEAAFGMWLAIGLIFVLGWFFAAVFWVTEQSSFLWADPVRYVMPATVPLLWLIVRYGRPSARAWAATYGILLLLCILPPAFLLQR